MTRGGEPRPQRPVWWPDAARHLHAADPVFAGLTELAEPTPWREPGPAFGALVRAVIGQQISVKAAASVWNRLLDHTGCAAPNVPDARQLRSLSVEALRGCGLSQRKAEYVLALADYFLAPGFSLQRLTALDDDALIAELVSIRGIGRWTAEMFLMFHLHRPDVLPLGDLGLRAAAGSLYGDGAALDAATVRQLAGPWRPYASAATWLLWRYMEADETTRAAIRSRIRSA